MKVVIVLATAVALAFGLPHPNLKPIITEVECLHKKTQDTEFDSVYVKDLKMNKTGNYEAELFCLAEIVLTEANLTDQVGTCNVDKLRRNLKVYNKGTNCSVPKNGEEIILRSFLDDLKNLAKMIFARPIQKTRVSHS